MSLRTLAVLVAALAAMVVLLWTCAPDRIASSDTPAAPTAERKSAAQSRKDVSATGGAMKDPSTRSAASSMQQDIQACKRVMAALRCHEQMQRVRMSRGAQHLSQPPSDPQCAAEMTAVPWRPLFEAATHGHIPSMVRFADGSLFRHNVEWDLEAMDLYRRNGYGFLQRAAVAGEGTAVYHLARGLIAGVFGNGAVAEDRVRGLAYARLLLRHADSDWQSRLTREMIGSAFRFDAQEWARAEVLSHQLLSVDAEARLDGWNPNLNGPENDFGCAG